MTSDFKNYIDNIRNNNTELIEFAKEGYRWDHFEKDETIKVNFPKDYQYFIDNLGTGLIREFIWVLNAHSEYDSFNPFQVALSRKKDYEYLFDGVDYSFGYTFFPARNGLLPFGRTINGDYIYWLIDDLKHNKSSILILDEEDELEKFEMSFSEFILAIMKGELSSEIVSQECMGSNIFTPLDPSTLT